MADDHKEHRKRIKHEFRKNGLEHFADHKVLETLLFYCIPRRDTNVLGHRLMETFGSYSGVFDAPYELLLEVDGVGEEVATFLKLLAACNKRYMLDGESGNNTIKSCEDAKEYMRHRFLTDSVECVLLVCLNYSGKVVYSDKIAEGTLEQVEIIPKEVAKICLRANAVRAVLAHNHPGGFCNPSSKDLAATALLHSALGQMDVELFDHIIVASDGVFSMKESNMLPTMDGGWRMHTI